MDQYTVIGKDFFSGRVYKIGINHNEDFKICNSFSDRFKIILVTEGKGVIKIDNQTEVVLPSTAITLNEKEKISLSSNEKIKAVSLYFSPLIYNKRFSFDLIYKKDKSDIDESTINDLRNFSPFVTNNLEKKIIMLDHVTLSRFLNLFKEIENEANLQHKKWPCTIRIYLIEILFLIFRIYLKNSDPINYKKEKSFENLNKESNIDINEIILFLSTNYDKKITLNELANKFCTNRTSITEVFKKFTGTTVKSYLTDIRIKTACSMLKNTDLSISAIIDRVGFSDPSHFIETFKKSTGFTPTEYRKKILAKNCSLP